MCIYIFINAYLYIYILTYICIYIHVYIYLSYVETHVSHVSCIYIFVVCRDSCVTCLIPHIASTGWRRLIGSPKLQIIFHKRATKYRSLLQKMTYKDKASYESSSPSNVSRCPMSLTKHDLFTRPIHFLVGLFSYM